LATDLNRGFVWQIISSALTLSGGLGASLQIQSKYNGLRTDSASGLGNMSAGHSTVLRARLAHYPFSSDVNLLVGSFGRMALVRFDSHPLLSRLLRMRVADAHGRTLGAIGG
jgi:hypothetical protein